MVKVQSELKAPKGQFNNFGKYKYRSCEDIVEAVKPVLAKYEYWLSMSDQIIDVGDRVYVQATCKVMRDNEVIAESTAVAREAETKKGMDDSQITGAASSYARKYALNGLFAIDDTKDADSGEHHDQVSNTPAQKPAVDPAIVKQFRAVANMEDLALLWGSHASKAYEQFKDEAKLRIMK